MLRSLLAILSVASSLQATSALVVRQDNSTTNANSTATTTGGAASSSPSPSGSASASGPTATIYPAQSSGGKVEIEGVNYPQLKQSAYYGIPFAKPPVGDLRLEPTEDPYWNVTSFSATKPPPACLQAPSVYTEAHGQSEDCLYLNVLTPEGVDYTKQSLPVMVWVYGGSFVTGTSSVYNGSVIMSEAMQTDRPVIFVTVNYRLGIFGFPGGKEVAQAGAANLGLRDVIKSLEWVQENIWAFAGDPGQVTVFGESAGAILTSLLYLQPDTNLFKSAIMESGAQSVAPIAPTAEFWQGPFDLIQNYTNCSAPVSIQDNSTSSSNASVSRRADSDLPPEITCLKYVPAEALLQAQIKVQQNPRYGAAFVFAPSIDGDLIPDSPHELLAQGAFARKPFISGNNVDEGTKFVPLALANFTQDQLGLFIASIEPTAAEDPTSILQQLLTYYPNEPALGSPFGTGNETFGLPPQFKQAAAILGDGTFQSSRRWFLQNANQYGLDQIWTYLFAQAGLGQKPYLGVAHADEISYVFGIPIAQAAGDTSAAQGLLDANGTYTSEQIQLSKDMINYWLNFAWYTNPNGDGSGNATNWPTYTDDKNMLFLNTSNITVIPDTYREDRINFFLNNAKAFNYKRWSNYKRWLGME